MSLNEAIELAKVKSPRSFYLDGKKINLSEECRKRGLIYSSLLSLINRGNSVEDAIARQEKLKMQKAEEKINISKICVEHKLDRLRVKKLLQKGYSIEEIISCKKLHQSYYRAPVKVTFSP